MIKILHCASATMLEFTKHHDYLHLDTEPRRVIIVSEPYVIFTKRGYQAVVDATDIKKQQNYVLFLSSKSLAAQLEPLRQENNGHFTGLEFWVRKESFDQKSPYIVHPF